MRTKEVIYIADDLGMSREVNDAVIKAYREGALHGASLMMGQEATEDAVRQALEHPGLWVGFHFHMADSKPMTMAGWPWGHSPARAGIALGFSKKARNRVLGELETQWEAFEATGLPCRFANSHHHLHIHPFLLGAFLDRVKLTEEGWVRLGDPMCFDGAGSRWLSGGARALKRWGLGSRPHPPSPDTLWGIDRSFAMNSDEIRRVVAGLPTGRHEFIFHPRQTESDADLACLLELKEESQNA